MIITTNIDNIVIHKLIFVYFCMLNNGPFLHLSWVNFYEWKYNKYNFCIPSFQYYPIGKKRGNIYIERKRD